MKTFATPKLDSATLVLMTTNTAEPRPIFDMSAYILSQFPSLGDQGLSGYSYVIANMPVSVLGLFPGGDDQGPSALDPNATVGGFIFTGVVQNSSPEALRKLWDPIFAHVNATWPGRFMLVYLPASFPSFLGWFAENYDTTEAGIDTITGSRLLDRRALTANLTALSAAFERFADGEMSTAYLISGKGVRDARPRGCGGNAVLPAWRRAYVHATLGVIFPPLNATAAADAAARVRRRVAALTELAPDMGAYVNEVRRSPSTFYLLISLALRGGVRNSDMMIPRSQANYQEPNFQKEFWGTNYKRLCVSPLWPLELSFVQPTVYSMTC